MDFPMKNGDFPWQTVSSPEGIPSVFLGTPMVTTEHLHRLEFGPVGAVGPQDKSPQHRPFYDTLR